MAAWWVIEESVLLDALRAAAGGEDPSIVLLELTANSSAEHVEGEQ
jgi:hypothetical protein